MIVYHGPLGCIIVDTGIVEKNGKILFLSRRSKVSGCFSFPILKKLLLNYSWKLEIRNEHNDCGLWNIYTNFEKTCPMNIF